MGCELEARKTVTAGEMNTTYGRRDEEGGRERGREGGREEEGRREGEGGRERGRGREGGREEERKGRREGGREGGKREGKEKREREIHYFQQMRIDPVSERLLLHSLILPCQGQRSFITRSTYTLHTIS